MKKKIINWTSLVLLLIIIGAFFVRSYKFDDWLYFKMDQSRDALLINNIVENGPGYLPLLGARAGATTLKHGFLRLGPIFYYFQYASAMIFHSTEPYVYAYPELFFSMTAILLLYFFMRLYFSKKHSLMITAMYAFAFIIIQYSRFAWNPNSLQFFLLLSFYGMLRFLNEPVEKRKKWWLVVWILAMAVGSQLHFFGFFTLLGASGLMLIFHFQLWKKDVWREKFKKESLQKIYAYILITLAIFAVLYAPVIISDSRKNWQNSKNFIEALGSKPVNKPFMQKISKDVTENARYYCLIATSQCYEGSMRKEVPSLAVTALVMFAGLALVIRGLRKKNMAMMRRDFLMMILIWVGVFTILTVPVSFQLRPRFFIVVFAIPFMFLGLIYEYLEEKMSRQVGIAFGGKKASVAISILLTVIIIGWNSHGTYAWFKEQDKSQKSSLIVKRTLILKAKDGVTLGQLQGVTNWMYAQHKEGNTLYYYVKPEHVRPIEYLLVEKHDKNLNYASMKINEDPNAQFFAITPTKSGLSPVTKKFGSDITIIASEKFGQITAYEIDFPNRTKSESDKFKLKTSSAADDRLYWKDVFAGTKK